MNISSRKNSAVQHYRSLNRERRVREETGEFNVEGAKLCSEAVSCGLTVTAAFITENAIKKYSVVYEKLKEKTEVFIITEDISEYISDTKSPQGVFITVKMLDKNRETGKIENGKYVILDGLQDSGNIGTIIRTCDALGMDGVILSPDCADVYSPKLVRSAMGSLFRLPFFRAVLPEAIENLKKKGFKVYAAMLDEGAESLSKAKFPEKTAVIIGNEGNGVSKEVASAAENRIYIPIKNAESLNAAVAASILCWEIKRQSTERIG